MWPFKRRATPTILVEVSGGVVKGVVADAETSVRVIIYNHDNPISIQEYNPPRVEKDWSIEPLGPCVEQP